MRLAIPPPGSRKIGSRRQLRNGIFGEIETEGDTPDQKSPTASALSDGWYPKQSTREAPVHVWRLVKPALLKCLLILERETGIEPATFSLGS